MKSNPVFFVRASLNALRREEQGTATRKKRDTKNGANTDAIKLVLGTQFENNGAFLFRKSLFSLLFFFYFESLDKKRERDTS